MEHTKEPWWVKKENIIDRGDAYGIRSGEGVTEFVVIPMLNINPEDASRIVACVNACAGLDPVVLSAWNLQGATVKQQMAEAQQAVIELQEQRDELLAAMESVCLWMEDQADGQSKGGHATFDLMMLREHRDIARAAIAKATAQPAQPTPATPDTATR